MKIGIIGLSQTGKKTLFRVLTGQELNLQSYKGNVEIKTGMATIRDARFDRLVKMYQPKKNTPATIDLMILPKFDRESVASGEFAKSLEKCDALCHIVRCFTNNAIFHEKGSISPIRDIDNIFTELILRDLILVEKRLERIELDQKKRISLPQQAKEKEILRNMKQTLDRHLPLILFELSDDDKKLMSTYHFLTRKPMIIVLNVNDDALSNDELVREVKTKYSPFHIKVMQISATIEAELISLNETEREEFLHHLSIKESALNQFCALCFEALNLISFFTVGKTEVHQWITRAGSTASQAAGVIHSDLERGFIRAEIFTCQDLFELGSETAVKEAGKWLLKGKDYTIQDGDIMLVRFNV